MSATPQFILDRRARIRALGKQGLTINAISRIVKSNHDTVRAALPKGYVPKPCPCGKPAVHTGTCWVRNKSKVQNLLAKHQTSQDSLAQDFHTRILNAIPVALTPETRGEIVQMMLVDLAERFDEILQRVPEYVKRYYSSLPWKNEHVFIDSDPKYYGERIVG